jgi:hypothetical protein
MEATRVDDIRPKKFLHQLRLENKKMGIYNKLLAGCAAFVLGFCFLVLVANMLDPAVIKHCHENKMTDKDTETGLNPSIIRSRLIAQADGKNVHCDCRINPLRSGWAPCMSVFSIIYLKSLLHPYLNYYHY